MKAAALRILIGAAVSATGTALLAVGAYLYGTAGAVEGFLVLLTVAACWVIGDGVIQLRSRVSA